MKGFECYYRRIGIAIQFTRWLWYITESSGEKDYQFLGIVGSSDERETALNLILGPVNICLGVLRKRK